MSLTSTSSTAHEPNNFDPAELSKFSDLAHHWWDKEGEFRPLHLINPLRLGWIESFRPLKGLNVLDVGCGGGILADSMSRKGGLVTGIDLSSKVLKIAQLHALETKTPAINYRQISVENLANEKPGYFDIVTCMEMLEHVPNPSMVVNACSALVKPGGYIYFSTINRNLKAFLLASVGAEYILNMLPKGTHEYARFIKPYELSEFCRNAEINVECIRGLEYNPLTRHYFLSEDTTINYLVAAQKI